MHPLFCWPGHNLLNYFASCPTSLERDKRKITVNRGTERATAVSKLKETDDDGAQAA